MTPQTLREISKLLHQARKLLPEPPPIEDMKIRRIHQRILSLEIDTQNLALSRERADQKKGPR